MKRIDFHCHILPKADHGSDSLETSLIQARNAVSAGICCTVATPHFYPKRDSVDDFLRRREYTASQLREALAREEIPLFLTLGAEVALTPDLPESDRLESLTVGGSRYLLLELPDEIWTPWVFDAVYRIESERKLVPVIAHIDRYPARQTEKLFEMGLLTQANAECARSVSGRRLLLRRIEEGKVHFLGSDAHGTGENAYAAFAKTCSLIEKIDDAPMRRAARILLEGKRRDVG